MDPTQTLERILSERPKFHRSETEIVRSFVPSESGLYPEDAVLAASGRALCHGITPAFARYLLDKVKPGMKTLETGAGISTLVFAIRNAEHCAVTPSADEVAAIHQYANRLGISLDHVKFLIDQSDRYLPRCELTDLEIVLLDGKHAFPWPIIDWFYTADRLVTGGLMILDDTNLPAVRVVVDFLNVDRRWKFQAKPGGRTAVFRKCTSGIHDVAWHMQPWNLTTTGPRRLHSLAKHALRFVRRRRSSEAG